MTTAHPGQKEILDYLKSQGKREKYAVIVGGPTTAAWAEEIGAGGSAETAVDGVKLALKTLQQKRKGQLA